MSTPKRLIINLTINGNKIINLKEVTGIELLESSVDMNNDITFSTD